MDSIHRIGRQRSTKKLNARAGFFVSFETYCFLPVLVAIDSFCVATKIIPDLVISARFLCRSEGAHRRSRKWNVA